MGFKEIALNMASRGVAVVPTQAGLRYPNLPEWHKLATTNTAQICAWDKENPSFNCVSVAKFGGVGMYDIDDVLTCAVKGMPQLPETFEVTSPSGGTHGYFIHTPETEALGATRNVSEGKAKIFELKGHNAACCSPGCTREDGGQYVLTKDVPLSVGLPAELIRWIEDNSAAKVTKGKMKRKFHPGFEKQDLFDHYGWTFAGDFWKEHAHYWIFKREAGGQLFANFANNEITIVEATGPRRTDRRSRYSYIPDRIEEQREIVKRHPLGLHFVGDWHTHPEHHGCPSSTDLSSISETVRKSRHCLNGFVLVVVGYSALPASMHVSVHDGDREFELELLDPTRPHGNVLQTSEAPNS
jgi:integrative and conjugative element protein (TIGR02256 family)